MKPNTIEDILRRLVEDVNGCHNWTGTITDAGYGQVAFNGKTRKVHRVVYEHFRGPALIGLHLDHLCRNRACANPAHLEPVTSQENSRRGAENKTHCLRGHLLSGDNAYITKHGHRTCRACVRESNQRRYVVHREAILARASRRKKRLAEEARQAREAAPPRQFCRHGHAWIPENLYDGRKCRLCIIPRARQYRARQKEKRHDG